MQRSTMSIVSMSVWTHKDGIGRRRANVDVGQNIGRRGWFPYGCRERRCFGCRCIHTYLVARIHSSGRKYGDCLGISDSWWVVPP